MARVRILVPPPQPASTEVGEIDMEELKRVGQDIAITGPRKMTWATHTVPFEGGSLIYVPSIPPERL